MSAPNLGDTRLLLLLNMLRQYHDSLGLQADMVKVERILSDQVMFNLGWYAAKNHPAFDLPGSAATAKIVPALMGIIEATGKQAIAKAELEIVEATLIQAKGPRGRGRKKGSYKAEKYGPGYQIVAARMEINDGGKKSLKARIRDAVREGWLDRKTADSTHEMRVRRLLKRWAELDANRVESLGSNIIHLASRKRKTKTPRH